MKADQLLRPYFDSGYPVVAIETVEETRLVKDCTQETDDSFSWGQAYSIAATGGLRSLETDEDGYTTERVVDAQSNLSKSFSWILDKKEVILFVFDFQHIATSAQSYRPLLQSLSSVKANGSMIVLVAPSWNIPPELKHQVPVIQLPLPNHEELQGSLNVVLTAVRQEEPEVKLDEGVLISSARGLTLAESENVFSLSYRSGFSKEVVEREKMRLVKSGFMTIQNPLPPESLAGYERLKTYVNEEVLPMRDDEQLRVRGIMLVGVQGTGKSLSAKVIASLLGWPLIRFDMSAAKGPLLGQSEGQLRQGLAVADAVSPAVLWADEIEKAVGGFSSSAATDGGTTLSMVGTLLTWLQEHTSPVLFVATCNDFSKLPPELSRAGRFDERFFLDLPTSSEREAIAKVHLLRLDCKEDFADAIGSITQDWTGAEIEQLVKSAARRTRRKLSLSALEEAAKEVIPISKNPQVQQLREWAKSNLRPANSPEVEPSAQRKIRSRNHVN